MHIAVITNCTPDTAAAVAIDSGGNLKFDDKLVVNPWDEYAITEAILLKEAHNGQVSIITLGGPEHEEALKHGLAIGCDQAIRIWDDALQGWDSLAYASAVAAAITRLGGVDLVIFGKELPDIASEAHIFQTARKLGWSPLGFVAKIEAIDPAARTIRVRRQVESGTETVASRLPAVISVIKDINEPKYPTFIGIRKAAKASIPVWKLADLGLDAAAVAPKTRRLAYQDLPKREGAVEIIDDPAALVDKLLEDKVI